MKTLYQDSEGALLECVSSKRRSTVTRVGSQWIRPGSEAARVIDTGNGYRVCFPSDAPTDRDTVSLTLDYDQARNLVIALAPFARNMGFKS